MESVPLQRSLGNVTIWNMDTANASSVNYFPFYFDDFYLRNFASLPPDDDEPLLLAAEEIPQKKDNSSTSSSNAGANSVVTPDLIFA